MDIAVVILNWNTEGYLRSFLPPLLESLPEGACAVVADNGSTDGSVRLLQEEFRDVRTILLDRNYGFTGGYNCAIGQLLSEDDPPRYVLLLNSDILTGPGWLEPLVRWMDEHPGCGACGPKLHALDPDPDAPATYIRTDRFEYAGAAGGYLDRYGYPFCRGRVLKRTETDEGQYDTPKEVLWVSGACMLVRSSVWKALGGLDERFFAHMEEIDLCWRMQLRSWTVSVVPDSVVWHLGGGSLPKDSPWKLQRNYCNNLLMLENNLAATLIAARQPIPPGEKVRKQVPESAGTTDRSGNFPVPAEALEAAFTRTVPAGSPEAVVSGSAPIPAGDNASIATSERAGASGSSPETGNSPKAVGSGSSPETVGKGSATVPAGGNASIATSERAGASGSTPETGSSPKAVGSGSAPVPAGSPETGSTAKQARFRRACIRKARRRIFFRMVLDGISAVVYCLQGHPEFASAVIRAHREFREKRRGIQAPEPGTVLSPVAGYTGIFLLPAAFTRGSRIFKYLSERLPDPQKPEIPNPQNQIFRTQKNQIFRTRKNQGFRKEHPASGPARELQNPRQPKPRTRKRNNPGPENSKTRKPGNPRTRKQI